ncbi:MAG: hypothetical protein J6X61_00890 [Clostridia bacterium]|nr:hypothetical protein [Clostridia bacterium]
MSPTAKKRLKITLRVVMFALLIAAALLMAIELLGEIAPDVTATLLSALHITLSTSQLVLIALGLIVLAAVARFVAWQLDPDKGDPQ